VAALGILGLLGPTIGFLDSLGVELGHFRLSIWLLVKTLLILGLLLWIAALAARVLNARIERLPQFTPSVRVLLAKASTVGLIAAAVLVALTATGLDLTVFAVIGGAIGLGVGFGLQKIVSNLVSGVILLLDRSIKPGDVIELGDTYGWITFLGARYAAVQTRDRTEWLIPNEDLITNRVVNWSRSDELVRLHAPCRVSYDSDLRKAIALAEQAARKIERVVEAPAPRCLVTAFGESAVELDLRFWILDPQNGTRNVRSAVFLAIWDAFREEGIRIPFPQRDVWLRQP
jgi:small-conductance mechanosensitive channel